jgi:hypothetical protein
MGRLSPVRRGSASGFEWRAGGFSLASRSWGAIDVWDATFASYREQVRGISAVARYLFHLEAEAGEIRGLQLPQTPASPVQHVVAVLRPTLVPRGQHVSVA